MEINSGVHLYLKVKSAKCLCLLPVVLVLLIWSWSCKQRSCSWSWSCHFGLGLLGLVYITVQIRKIFILSEHLQWAGAYCGCTACYVRFSFFLHRNKTGQHVFTHRLHFTWKWNTLHDVIPATRALFLSIRCQWCTLLFKAPWRYKRNQIKSIKSLYFTHLAHRT